METDIWHRLKIIEDMTLSDLKVGDKFLTGRGVIDQREFKNIGDRITYYEVISINNNNNINYAVRIEILEEVKK